MPNFSKEILLKDSNKETIYEYVLSHGIKFDYQMIQPTVSSHAHTFIEIFYVLDGKINHEFNGISATLSAGDFALVDYGAVHSFTKLENEDCSIINILFYPSFVDMTLANSVSFKDILLSNTIQCDNLPSDVAINKIYHEDNQTIKNLILTMQHEFFSCEFEYLKILRFMLMTLLSYILRHMIGKSSFTSKSTPIDSAINYIHNNYYRNLTLKELSDICHYTPQYFCKKFKSVTGYSFSEYIQKTRIDYSCRLLQHTNMKITEIADAVGYTNLKHYELLFRKFINRTPTEHRKFLKKSTDAFFVQV